ncbi:hypothetical protein AAXE64_07685 [Priestia megaterium]
MKVRCSNCTHLWDVVAGNLVRSSPSGCPVCSKKERLLRVKQINEEKVKLTRSNVKRKIKKMYGEQYELLSEYEHHRKKLNLKCEKHGLFEQRYDSLLLGHGCPKCGREKQAKTREVFNLSNLEERSQSFQKKFTKVAKGEYTLLSKYKSISDYVKVRHEKCGREWEVTPANFIWNCRRCPNCNLSKGMLKVEEYIGTLKKKYALEKRFENCKDNRPLPFDMLLDNSILIEYDGEHHFHKIDFSGKGVNDASDRHKNTKKHDQIKNTYCIKSDIPLIRIPYWELDNIDCILDHVLGYFNIIHRDSVDTLLVHKYLVSHPDWSHEKYISEAPCNKKKLVVS